MIFRITLDYEKHALQTYVHCFYQYEIHVLCGKNGGVCILVSFLCTFLSSEIQLSFRTGIRRGNFGDDGVCVGSDLQNVTGGLWPSKPIRRERRAPSREKTAKA